MFTGIIETTGKVISSTTSQQNLILQIQSPISHELHIDQSVSHNGICLTVTAIDGDIHTICAVPETISKSTIASWSPGSIVNLERCTRIGDRLDGHIVQGHVDDKALCSDRVDRAASWNYTFRFASEFSHLLVEKGSVAVNGVSLTCFNVRDDSFEVAIIPYTFEHTCFNQILVGMEVNIEFDVIGKYVARMMKMPAF